MKTFTNHLKSLALAVVTGLLLAGCVTNPMGGSEPVVPDTHVEPVSQQLPVTKDNLDSNEADFRKRLIQRTPVIPAKPAPIPRPTVSGSVTTYQDPGLAALNVVYVGAGSFADEDHASAVKDAFETQIFSALGGAAGQSELGSMVRGFFARVAGANPQLKMRVVGADEKRILGETIDHTAFASVAFNQAVLFETGFKSGAIDRTLYVSMPLFLVSAKSYQLIYSRPLFIRVRLEHGVSAGDPEVCRRVLDGVRAALESGTADAEAMAPVAEALKRGTFSDPNRLIYAVNDGAITFSESARHARTGFGHSEKVGAVLREAASDFLARTENVFPPIQASLSPQLYRELGANYFGLEVVTDLAMLKGFPVSGSGRIILPIKRAQEDINLAIQVKTGLQVQEQGAHFKSGLCQVLLEIQQRNPQNQTLQNHKIVQNGKFRAHLNQVEIAQEDCLMDTLLACAAELKSGLK